LKRLKTGKKSASADFERFCGILMNY